MGGLPGGPGPGAPGPSRLPAPSAVLGPANNMIGPGADFGMQSPRRLGLYV